MMRLGLAAAAALAISLVAHADSMPLSANALDTLTAIDQAPTSQEIAGVLAMPQLASLTQIAAGSPTIDPGVQLRAIEALTQYVSDATDQQQGHATLVALLGPDSRYATATAGTDLLVLRAALEALGPVGRGDAGDDDVGLIAPFLNHASRDVRTTAARALRDLGNSDALGLLRTRLAQESLPQVKLAISDAIRVLSNAP
jgi:hypothetical protein